MKRYGIFLWMLLTAITGFGQSVAGVRDVRGQSIPLDSLTGKKLLIVILPTTKDTALTGQLLRFQRRHARQVAILGIVSQGTSLLAMDTTSDGYGRSEERRVGKEC